MGIASSAGDEEEVRLDYDAAPKDALPTVGAEEVARIMSLLEFDQKDIKRVTDDIGNRPASFEQLMEVIRDKAYFTGNEQDIKKEFENVVKENSFVESCATYFIESFPSVFGSVELADEDMKAAFDKIDTDKSGFLDKKEFSEFLRLKQEGKPDTEIENIKNLIDSAPDKEISFEKFKNAIVQLTEMKKNWLKQKPFTKGKEEISRLVQELEKKKTRFDEVNQLLEHSEQAEEEKSELIKQLQSQLDAYDRERAR